MFFVAHSTGPATPTALAKALGVTRGAVTQMLAGLLGAGLVEQQRDLADGRRRVVVLSPDSRARVAGFERDLSLRVAGRFSTLSEDELEMLVVLLEKTKENP
ncbi:MAG: MarR family winged helix-turn-helix transcriptional regulator [Propionicimonas sp.]